jgi:murein DD-endopeptidase MepM/ murein hydrolase activator NlpD
LVRDPWLAGAAVAASLLAVVRAQGGSAQGDPARPSAQATAFQFPCDGYLGGLRGKGNFGAHIADDGAADRSPFAGSWHLAEDVWLPAGTEVRAVADGVVKYSDFSPSWVDEKKRVHWNLGNVVVIEHPLDPPIDGLAAVCSVSVHLAADRRVAAGDAVKRGQPIGRIGKDRSEENGNYPAHLHFGVHRGPYLQIAPSFRRQLEEEARTTGIPTGDGSPLKGEIELVPQSETSVLVRAKTDKSGARDPRAPSVLLSLLVGSTAPGKKPADIVSWCSGYGDRATVDEWLPPSTWIAARRAVSDPGDRALR